MEAQSAWKAQLKFSERMSTTLKISEAFHRAFPNTSSLEARAKAREIEDAALQQAPTRSEYETIYQRAITAYLNLAPGKELSDEQDKPNGFQKPETTFDIGPYKNCIYHKSGLFSTIYKGRSPGYTFLCAIKETSLSTEEPPHNSEREARLLRKAAHPNVVELLEVTRLSNGHLLLSFPFLPFTLEDLLDFQSPLMTKDLMGQLFRGLAHLHSSKLGILHRDLKPSNILLTRRRRRPTHTYTPDLEYDLFIADFGIAWHADDPASEPADAKITDIGTTCYRAPELLFGCRDYGAGIDLWSAGCVVAEMLMHHHRTHQHHHLDDNNNNNNNNNGDDDTDTDMRLKHRSTLGSGRRSWTLFHAGPLGSDLALIQSIFETLGTPNTSRWPESATLPDWGKISFVEYPPKRWGSILPSAGAGVGNGGNGGDGDGGDEDEDDDDDGVVGCCRRIVAKLVQYQSSERMSAQEVCDLLRGRGLS